MFEIKDVLAREVFDSRGFPTVEAEVVLEQTETKQKGKGRAIVPSGASTGEGEALELRDGDPKRLLGKGVLKAVGNVQTRIKPAILGKTFANQALLDDVLRALDGTNNKGQLGANAILAVSMAFSRACADANQESLIETLARMMDQTTHFLPVPMMNIINGGQHADNALEIQEFMVIPAGFKTFREAFQAGAEVFHHLKKILSKRGFSTNVGDEGGFAPEIKGENAHETALKLIMEAIKEAGYKAGTDIFLGLDVAASEFFKDGAYHFEGKKRTSQDMIALYASWAETYPLVSIEDGLAEHDWEGWKALTEALGKKLQLVGDDLFVTNAAILQKGIDGGFANSILIKLNQIGTVTETLETIRLAQKAHFEAVISHRSGETEDTFIASLAVASGAKQIKTGSASRTDRMAKYNELLRIEDTSNWKFAGKSTYSRL
jgi:enolase